MSDQLRKALRDAGIDPDFDKWRDTQKLGAAVRDAVAPDYPPDVERVLRDTTPRLP